MGSSDYSLGDRLLHHFVFGAPFVNEMSFDLDGLLLNKVQQKNTKEKHLFISGLARAGTTILMRAFYDTGYFRSLTYRDMPFVLMPCLWEKLSRFFQKHEETKMRAHGDGIYVNFDSPEAFEEVFWRTFSGNDYIFSDRLQPHLVDQEIINKFRLYVRRIVGSSTDRNQQRYLSKNNNNILRLKSIQQAFPESLIIIPFRDPFQQAASLLYQHQKFCKKHIEDKFSYSYMQWLGHYEFGGTHRPFLFEKNNEISAVDHGIDSINYWLKTWINSYRYLLKSAPLNSFFVCFEDLCEFPIDTLRSIFKSADLLLNEDILNKTFTIPPTKHVGGIDEKLRSQAILIYKDLCALTART